MMYPLAHAVTHRPYLAGTEDAHGNPTTGYGPSAEVRVYGWHTGQTTEPSLAGHDRVELEGQVFAPGSFRPGPLDLIVLGGEDFEVVGHPEDYNHGPFGFTPGVVVNVRRVTG